MKRDLKKEVMLKEIEVARKHMIKLAYENPLCSKVVVEASTNLDKLLNTFNHTYKKEPCRASA
ncbi:aspartyl-phosphate phosphatase Spo0E family protein [Anaerobacillus isosaccharinicus]|uniref:Aspartyl-phosphate phosphatase Spo0E family protein n=1 Tax=Anaerobacillus isosaccharinicus TaxID=1532552 RepID=A0A1S2MED3_9BACI|nr:aspartyl-phosphate phosphatase Spo0E family protein [Anaerobacillus isosaccharinicus]MBA5584010.1 aspartyl-phosphate phosphatase Spo0E family protein [Anaerobacillus isosaccharinicus]QOY37574.1 aspartyl-phosphate phosphatase Spo0E family protein [Anaerobacillus isosaccharinicus]